VRDDDKTLARGVLIATAAVFLLSTYAAWRELRFAVAARTAVATVDRVTETTIGTRRTTSRRRRMVRVEYHFVDASGAARTGSFDNGPLAPRPAPGSTLTIEYLDNASRPAGRSSGGALAVFVASLAGLVAGGLFYRHKVRQAAAGT